MSQTPPGYQPTAQNGGQHVFHSRVIGMGEMADLTREYAWSDTAIGAIEHWPDTLLILVNTVLASRHPMLFWWGSDLIQFYNDAYRNSLGYEKHPRALGQRGADCWPEIWGAIAPQIEASMTRGEASWNEDQLLPIYRDGKLEDSYWTYSYSPVRDPEGVICGTLVTCSETTRRILAEAEKENLKRTTRAIEERAQLALNAANGVGTWDWDLTRNLVYTDARFAAANGLQPGEALGGVSILELFFKIHPDDRGAIERKVRHALDTGEDFSAEYRLLQPDGSARWVLALGRCILSESGIPARFAGVNLDITQRKQDEEQLRNNQEALRTSAGRSRLAQEAGKISVWEWNLATNEFTWDEGSRWVYGRPPSEMRHLDQILEYLHQEDRARVLEDVRPAVEGRGRYHSQFRVFWPDGSMHWIDARGGSVFAADGTVEGLIGANMDVTDRKLAEEALIRNEKLAIVGRLASSIAHEINNPLESVTNLFYLARTSPDLEQAHAYLDSAEVELRRVAAIANQTLRFHKQSTRPVKISCEDLIAGVLAIFTSRITNSNITVEKRKRALTPVLCFEGEIRQVLSNLVGNAIDAMQSTGGRLLMRSRESRDWRTGRTGLVITVADTGPGIPRDALQKIFEPFFTTKGIGGTGLGLWISREILERHKGHLTVRSRETAGRSGSVFCVFLPFDAAPRPA